MNKKITLFCVVFTGIVVLLSLGTTLSFAASEIKVGILGPMTGPGSLMGQGQRDGAILAIEKFNAAGGYKGRKIGYIIMDDQAQPTLGVNAAKKLVYKDEVLAVIGTPNSPVCLATMKITQEAKTPQIMFGVAAKITEMGNYWLIRITPSDQVMASNYVTFVVKDRKMKKIAIFHDSTDYGKGGRDGLEAKMKQMGMKPTLVESFNVGDKDFSAQLNKIKNENVDGVFLWGLYVEGAQILTQAKQLGLTMPFMASSGVNQGAFMQLAGKAAEGLYVVTYFSLDNPAKSVQDFIKEFKKRFDYDPNPVAATAFDGTNLLLNAIKKVGVDRKKIMDELRSVKGYKGVAGLMQTDKVGQTGQSSIIMQVKDGKFKVIWSSD